jgi:four helix bundle protein
MATFKRFEEIEAWQLARDLCKRIHHISATTALSKDYKLRDQINGSSGSVMDNIAEGFGRGGNREFVQFLEIAHGSAAETQSQLYRVCDRGYISEEHFTELYALADQTSSKILGLIHYLKSATITGPRYK